MASRRPVIHVLFIVLPMGGCGGLTNTLLSPDTGARIAGSDGTFTAVSGIRNEDARGLHNESHIGEHATAAHELESEADTTEPGMSPAIGADANRNDTGSSLIIDTAAGQSIDSLFLEMPNAIHPIGTSELDPLSVVLGDPALFGDLLPLLIDDMLIDALGPTGGSQGSFASSFTHLELLCRDRGLPETFCRRRYGD